MESPNHDSIPLYYKVHSILRESIIAGVYKPGDLLPTQESLTRKFNVSRITIRKALEELAREGLVAVQQGRGTTVLDQVEQNTPTRLKGAIENSFVIARMTQARIIGFDFVDPPRGVVEALKLKENQQVLRVEKIRFFDGETFSHGLDYVHSDLGRRVSLDGVERFLLMELLEKKAKIHVTSGEQLLTAVTAEPSLASLLNIRVGAPLLRAERTLYDSELRPVQFVVAHYRGDRYSVLVNLERSGFQPEDIKNWKINPEGSRVHVSRG